MGEFLDVTRVHLVRSGEILKAFLSSITKHESGLMYAYQRVESQSGYSQKLYRDKVSALEEARNLFEDDSDEGTFISLVHSMFSWFNLSWYAGSTSLSSILFLVKHMLLVFAVLNFRHHLFAHVSSIVVAVCALAYASSKVSEVMKIAISSAYRV